MEVRNVLSYLTIINNSTIDISMAAVLRSGFYQVSAKEMAFLQIQSDRELSLIQKIWCYIENYNSHIKDTTKSLIEASSKKQKSCETECMNEVEQKILYDKLV